MPTYVYDDEANREYRVAIVEQANELRLTRIEWLEGPNLGARTVVPENMVRYGD